MFYNCTSIQGDIAFDSSKTNAEYARTTNGYFTYKAAPASASTLSMRSPMAMFAMRAVRAATPGTLLAGDGWYQSSQDKSVVTAINLVNSYSPAAGAESWDASVAGNDSIMCYMEGTVLTIVDASGTGVIMANADSSEAFAGFSSAKEINGLDMLNTMAVTDMTRMFYGCSSIDTLDLSSFDTHNIANADYMTLFAAMCTDLDHIILNEDFGQYKYNIKYNGNKNTSGSMATTDHLFENTYTLAQNAYTRSESVVLNYNGSGQANQTMNWIA